MQTQNKSQICYPFSTPRIGTRPESAPFPVQRGAKQADMISFLLFNALSAISYTSEPQFCLDGRALESLEKLCLNIPFGGKNNFSKMGGLSESQYLTRSTARVSFQKCCLLHSANVSARMWRQKTYWLQVMNVASCWWMSDCKPALPLPRLCFSRTNTSSEFQKAPCWKLNRTCCRPQPLM